MKDTLIQFKEVIDEEIQAYEMLGELYKVKQSLLVQGKSDELWDIDSQIISKADEIKTLNGKRKDVAKYLGDENLSMSEIIEKAKAANDTIYEKLEKQQVKLRILTKSLLLQENTNMTLIKHGLTMVGKTLDIIVGALMPQVQSEQYDKSGHSIKGDKSLISSVIEEA